MDLMTWTATSAPRAQSCTCNNCHMAKNMPNQIGSGARDLFKTKNILQGCFSFFFLQGRKSKLTQITGTKNIFKLCLNNKFRGLFTMNIFCEIFCQTKFKEFQMISKNFKFIHYCVKCQSQIGSYNSFKLCKLIPIGFKHLCISP